MQIELVRYAYLPTATLGLWRLAGERFETIERPWIPNPAGLGGLPRESCVPDGFYKFRPWQSPKHGAAYILDAPELGVYTAEVPAGQPFGRALCLLHAANQVSELLGCIAPGMRAAVIEGEHRVLESRRALARIHEVLGRSEVHDLMIRTTAGTEEPE